MCGICGMIDLRGEGRVNPALVRAMSQKIAHRGPDGDGFYDSPDGNLSMGMRRLSIIDVAGSDQPLYNEDKSIVMVFNGEIYNYRDLRRDLSATGHQLRTQGDGETIIHLWEDHESDAERVLWLLRGMYAVSLWDSNRKTLLLTVDHIGMKPLYTFERDGLLAYASEVKAFLALPGFVPALNLNDLGDYLSFGYSLRDQTLLNGVTRLLPGTYLKLDLASSNPVRDVQTYWTFNALTAPRVLGPLTTETEIITQVRDVLDESVRLHLESDVPLGLFLSGGIDSAAILALMARHTGGVVGDRVKTFTVGYHTATPDNELEAARHSARDFGADHHELVITAKDWWAAFQDYAYFHDEPNANPSAISLLMLSRLTVKHVKVVLTGLGGDELFYGYRDHRRLPQVIRRQNQLGPLRPFLAALLGLPERWYPAMRRYRFIGALPTYLPPLRHALMPLSEALRRSASFDGMVFSDALRHRLYGPSLRDLQPTSQYDQVLAGSTQVRGRAPENIAQALVINTWLPGNALLSQDKTAMAASLEARVPFFDPRLIEIAGRIPPAIQLKSNKYVLREAVGPFFEGVPDGGALGRPKKPFSTPIMHWFDHDLRDEVQSVLRDPGALCRQLFKPAALDKLLDAHFGGHIRLEEVLFRLVTLELWAKAFHVTL